MIETFEARQLLSASALAGRTPAPPVPSAPTAIDYTNGAGATVHVVFNGTTGVVFVDSMGRISVGTVDTTTHRATDNLYPVDVATFSNNNNTVTWLDGTVWTMTTTPANQLTITSYINQSGKSTYSIRNGTSDVIFVDQSGIFTSGTFVNATQATDSAYPNDLATFTATTVDWQDGTVWTIH